MTLNLTVNPRAYEQEPAVPRSPTPGASAGPPARGGDRQWIRQLRLTVEQGGRTLDLSGMRVRFTIKDSALQNPRTAEIRITNLSNGTAQLIPDGKNGGMVELHAGYEGNIGRIFKGTVKQRRIGRENPTDTAVDISAATFDRPYNHAAVNRTLKAGSTGRDVYDACLAAMAPFGVRAGQVADELAKLKYPRPVVLFGMARNHLRALAYTTQCTWNLRDEHLDVIPKHGALNGGPLLLTPGTGLISRPTQTDAGVIARCLINPQLGVNQRVQLESSRIDEAPYNLTTAGEPKNNDPFIAPIATNGLYRIVGIDHNGDTHGNPWFCDLYLLSLDPGHGPTRSMIDMGFV